MSKMLGESNKQFEEHLPLEKLLVENHDTFCLEEDKRGNSCHHYNLFL